MGAPTIHLFEDIFSYVDTATQQYVTDGAAAVAGAFQSTAHTLLIVYVMLWGWSMMRGLIGEPVTDGVARILKATLIVTFATNSAMYSSEIATFLYNWPSALAGVLAGGVAPSTTSLIDHVAATGLELASQAWQAASFANMGAYAVALVVFTMTLVVTALAAVIIISSKYGLALLLAIGPVFILMMLFDGTRGFFERWLSSTITAGMGIVLVSGAAALIFKYFGAAFDQAALSAGGNGGIVSLTDIAPATVAGIVGVFFLWRIPELAGSLGGGVSAAGAHAAGWAYDKIKGASRESYRAGKAGVNAGRKAYTSLRNSGRFGAGNGGSVKGSRAGAPSALYRKIVGSNSRRAAA